MAVSSANREAGERQIVVISEKGAARGKVVHVLTRLSRGGTEENTIATCAGQLELGYDVYLIHGAEWQEQIRATIPEAVKVICVEDLLHRIDPLADTRAVLAIRKLLKRLEPRVLHTHQSKGGIVGRFAAFGLPGVFVVHTVHIAPFVNVGVVQRWIYIMLEHIAARNTDRFISVSRGMMDAYLHYRIGKPEVHQVVHSGMELGKYVRAEATAQWRERIDWSGNDRPFVVLMLSAFDRRKRHIEFVGAIGDFLGAVPEALICFAGEGHCESEVREAIERSGFSTQFRFLGHDSHPEELIALADVCVLCSEREGLPRVLVQYVAACKRIVLMRLPGIDELLDDYAGATVIDQDFTSMMHELVRIHDDEYLPMRYVSKFPPVNLSRWENKTMVAGIESAYSTAEDSPPARPTV